MPTGKKLPPGPLTVAVATVLMSIANEKGVSQAAIGRHHLDSPMHISQSQVSRFFHHSKGIDVDQLNGLCQILGVSVLEVLDHAERRMSQPDELAERRRVRGSRQTRRPAAKPRPDDPGTTPDTP
ncbi:helix-turn-helix transcriptional regulator [Microbacterium sp. X-17]|uniref:helix-turn-helix domain-containing protein n=1 Tax=Microbacterium sp. X-17 TaxID=3144404 RepID=UPI0031F4D99E